MNNYILLDKKENLKHVKSLINKLKMKKTLENYRTKIWENDDIQISIDRLIIRILIYSKKDIEYYLKLFAKENKKNVKIYKR